MSELLDEMSALCAVRALGRAPPDWMTDSMRFGQHVSQRLPLVRVAVPASSGARREEEWRDVLAEGWLRAAHQSLRSARIEDEFGVSRSLYLHAGRGHPQYGTLAFVINELPDARSQEASPAGLGALACGRGEAPLDRTSHDGCFAPIAHDSLARRRAFYEATRWSGPWRERAAHFLAGYYGRKRLNGYFGHGEAARPDLDDPTGAFHNPTATDWRNWTI